VTIRVEPIAADSGSKDHVAMTGGTLSADKRVTAQQPITLQREYFPLAGFGPGLGPDELARLAAGVHSIEHSLASPEGGDLRARLAERVAEAQQAKAQQGRAEQTQGNGSGNGNRSGIVPGKADTAIGSRLVDTSPYVHGLATEYTGGLVGGPDGEPTIGFRSTFVTEGTGLADGVLRRAYHDALERAGELFRGGAAVPFATPESCGQYDLHNAEAAVELIERWLASPAGGLAGAAGSRRSATGVGAHEVYVCDLRLVKPRLAGRFDQRLLDVPASHYIAQAIEAAAWRSMPGANPGSISAGTFGCSTGAYLIVANPAGATPSDLLWQAHAAVAVVLIDLAEYQGGGDALRAAAADDARFALQHIEYAAPDILRAGYALAVANDR
jgi:S-ribosylhomocysteine lyase LuxS involved in autoinducer biosynthesis